MTFSVIIPTRNRPALLRRALASVVGQGCAGVEAIVVDDGSLPGLHAETEAVVAAAGPRARLHTLPTLPNGHGPAYSRNIGVGLASGYYVGFLDDDDEWTDMGYLARAEATLAARRDQPDLLLSAQVAVQNGEPLRRPVWTEDIADLVRSSVPEEGPDTYRVDLPLLMQSAGFCHLNTTLVRRDFLINAGGFDACLRYESDRDFYLRAIDAARVMLYSPAVVARHHVPDQARRDSASTSPSEMQRRLYQLRLLDKAILFSTHPELQQYGRRHKAYTLKRIAASLAEAGEHGQALFYAREAALLGPTLRWMAYIAWLSAARTAARLRPASRKRSLQAVY